MGLDTRRAGGGRTGGGTSGLGAIVTAGEEFSRDATLDVLNNQRRRFVIHYLKQTDETTLSGLAERVAGWEYGKPVDELSHRERKRVRNALRQFHLPKMADYGFVEYDAQGGDVRLTDAAAKANFYVDSITGGQIPWGVYYLGLSAVSLVCLAGVWLQLYPFSDVSPVLWGVFFVTALGASSLGHCYDNYYRMRLGAGDSPPEVVDP
jgi:hypothetical protein